MTETKWLSLVRKYLITLGYKEMAKDLEDPDGMYAKGWISNRYPNDPYDTAFNYHLRMTKTEARTPNQVFCGYD
jgi:hypothetical protein